MNLELIATSSPERDSIIPPAMAEPTGSPKPGNGAAHANGKHNGKSALVRTKARRGRGFVGWAVSLIARLATWSAILTILFRCPSSLEACDESSPFICKHYFRAKHAVSPHVQPYYDRYAAPYVDVAKPYYDTVNSRVLTPTRAYAVQYSAPWVKKGQDFAWAQWETNGQPQLARIQELAQARYDQSVAPHLTKAGEAVGPYYDIAKTNGLQLYYEYVLPSYEFVQPYAAQGYDAASDFTTDTALPAAYWAWNKTNVFLDTTVWPQLRVLYVDNVEPQLVRIGERLGRYKNQTKSRILPEKANSASPEAVSSSFSKPTPQSSTAPAATIEEPTVAEATESEKPTETPANYPNPVEAPPPAENESDKRRRAREMVAQDLELWQNKFAAQAEEGAADIEDRVDEIARRMVEENVKGTGSGLVKQLEETIASQLAELKTKISSIVEEDAEDAEQKVVTAVRAAGVAIKKTAQMIRGWREDYDAELQETVVGAADVHFQILDETRGLALQQIGMKWAWTDGVTYKDWAKYHELKNTLTQWTDELKQLIVTHPTLLEAQDASAHVEDEGMTMAAAAAQELGRLKEVARWKILAKDATDNFESEAMRLAAEAAQKKQEVEETVAEHLDEAQQVLGDAAEAGSLSVDDLSSAVEEAATATAEYVAAAASSATSVAVNEASIAAEAVKEQVSAAGSMASSVILGEQPEETPLAPQDTFNPVEEPIILGSPDEVGDTDSTETTAAVEEKPADTIIAEAADADAIEEEAEASTDLKDEEPPKAAESSTVHAAMFGAAAQEVPARQPVLDEEVDGDMIGSATSAAQEAYSNALSLASDKYSSAMSIVSAQVYGTPEPVHNELFASVSSAYDYAVAAASNKLNDAVQAASTGIYGKPTPTPTSPVNWHKVEEIAARRLSEGRMWAEIQYHSARLAMGLATPTPTSGTEKMLNQAKLRYYAGLGLAQDRYMSFISAASSAWSSVTATPTPTDFVGSASSLASVASESASSVAHAAGEAAGSAYSAATEGVVSAAQGVEDTFASVVDAAGEQIYIAGSAIAERWDNVVAEISANVYGEPTAIGWFEGLIDGAASATKTVGEGVSSATEAAQDAAVTARASAEHQYSAVGEMLSELVRGKEPAFTESVWSRFQAVYATASASASSVASEASARAASVGSKVGSVASHATDAVKDSVQHAKDEL
ncbi:quercetin 2,3-dioxygenase [Purpureocillium lavendulum]|uniref:Quercetin 2,3-dioxygenase n=1 Tax=Purpureocillium lavendulum TaxID=1247861 RepID=A0AB34FXE0_9HYPO|nr:quercetin 2,3-dioxygenase [Purpureocillium lavendulum]